MKVKMKICKINTLLLVAALVVVLFNTVQLSQVPEVSATSVSGATTTSRSVSGSTVIPTGVPAVYGEELGISYDDVSALTPQKADATIGVMANLDKTLTLRGDDMQKYIDVASQISCEYCCGAKSIIFEDGSAACGCAHSYAMRGLAKYLILNHGDEFTDDEILGELAKWKVLYFPTQITQKAAALEANGIEATYVNLGSNTYRGIEQGSAGGGMVGGC